MLYEVITKVRKKLPADIEEPQIIKITETTAPVMVLALSTDNKYINMTDIRDLASNEIKHKLLKTEGVANVDVFGRITSYNVCYTKLLRIYTLGILCDSAKSKINGKSLNVSLVRVKRIPIV